MATQPPNPASSQRPPQKQARINQVVNRSALVVTAFLAGIGVMRLLTALTSGDILPLRPVDGWLLMGLRAAAVLFTISMSLIKNLRERYLLFLMSLLLLTTSGLWLRLASLLPEDWKPTAGVAQLLMSVLGLGFIIAGLVQGEDLLRFLQDTWGRAFSRSSTPPSSG